MKLYIGQKKEDTNINTKSHKQKKNTEATHTHQNKTKAGKISNLFNERKQQKQQKKNKSIIHTFTHSNINLKKNLSYTFILFNYNTNY